MLPGPRRASPSAERDARRSLERTGADLRAGRSSAGCPGAGTARDARVRWSGRGQTLVPGGLPQGALARALLKEMLTFSGAEWRGHTAACPIFILSNRCPFKSVVPASQPQQEDLVSSVQFLVGSLDEIFATDWALNTGKVIN